MPKAPGLEESAYAELTAEARQAIDSHLRQHGRLALGALGALGLTTLLSVLLSLGYIFFSLPEEAASRAFKSWESRFSRYEKRVEDSLVQASELKGKTEATEEENRKLREENEKLKQNQEMLQLSLKSLEQQRDSLQKFLDKISIADLERAATIAASLEASTVVAAEQKADRAEAAARKTETRVVQLEENLRGAQLILERALVRLQELEKESSEMPVDAKGEPYQP